MVFHSGLDMVRLGAYRTIGPSSTSRNGTTSIFRTRWGREPIALPSPLPQPANIIERLPLAIGMVTNAGTTNELGLLDALTTEQRRAVALTWIFHLVATPISRCTWSR